MAWTDLASRMLETIKGHRSNSDGWTTVKEEDGVIVSTKTSPESKGLMYRTEGLIDCGPETVFQYINPTDPDGPRSKWDKSIKERHVVEKISENMFILRTITHSALAGLISSRDFVDLVVIENNDQFLASNATAVDHASVQATSDFVRGTNYPSTITCCRVPGSASQTKLVTLIQSDIGGMIPQPLIDRALPSSQLEFFTNLKKALQDGGHCSSP